MTCGQRINNTSPVWCLSRSCRILSRRSFLASLGGGQDTGGRSTHDICLCGNPGIEWDMKPHHYEGTTLDMLLWGSEIFTNNSHLPHSYYTNPFYGPSHMRFHPLLNQNFWECLVLVGRDEPIPVNSIQSHFIRSLWTHSCGCLRKQV